MNKFPILSVTLKALISIILSILNTILTVLYLCLPLWVFMAVMQLRDKNNKTSAIHTFTEDNSEFQFVFKDYMLVSVKPNNFRVNLKRRITGINNFMEKWKWTLLITLFLLLIIIVATYKFI